MKESIDGRKTSTQEKKKRKTEQLRSDKTFVLGPPNTCKWTITVTSNELSPRGTLREHWRTSRIPQHIGDLRLGGVGVGVYRGGLFSAPYPRARRRPVETIGICIVRSGEKSKCLGCASVDRSQRNRNDGRNARALLRRLIRGESSGVVSVFF